MASPGLVWAAAWAIWPVCLLFFKQVPAWRALPEALVLALPVLAAAGLAGNAGKAAKGAAFLAGTAVLMSAYGLLQAWGPEPGSWISPFHKGVASTIGNPDLLGGFLVLPFALSFSFYAKKPSFGRGAALALIGACLVVTESRAAWLGAAAVAAVVLVRTRARAAAAAVAAGAVFAAVWLAAHPELAGRALSKGALQERAWTWKLSCRAAARSPLTGQGPASFRTAYLAQQTASRSRGEEFYHYTEYAHCEPLHFLLELGVIGLGLWLWCLACFQRMLASSPARFSRPELWTGVAAGWIGLAPGVLLSFPFHVPATCAPLLFLTAFLSPRPIRAGLRPNPLAGAFVVILILVFALRLAVVSAGLRRASVMAAAGSPQGAAEECSRLLGITRGEVRILWNLAAALRSAGEFREAAVAAREGVLLEPDFFELYHELGMAEKEAGRPAEAVAAYRMSIRINPGFAGSFNNLGNLLGGMGRLREAEAAQRRALDLSPGFKQARQNLAITLMLLGKRSEARRVLEGGSR